MGRRPMVYGLDIETDCTENGTDPKVARVRTVALSSESCDEVFSGEEADLLEELDERLAALPPGVLATWNGAAFDLPFLADRAAVCGVPIGLRLRHDGRLGLRRAPLPGHPGAYRGSWYGHRHLDAYRVYRGDASASPRLPGGLRVLARFCGARVVDVERDFERELEREVRHAYAAGDARLARVLTERRWPGAKAYVDRRVPDHGPWVPPWFEEEELEVVDLDVHAYAYAGAGVGGRTAHHARPQVEVQSPLWGRGTEHDAAAGPVRISGEPVGAGGDAGPREQDEVATADEHAAEVVAVAVDADAGSLAVADEPAVAGPEDAVADTDEPAVADAEAEAEEPAVADTDEPAVAEVDEPAVAEVDEPAVAEADEPAVADTEVEPVVADTDETALAEAEAEAEAAVAGTDEPAVVAADEHAAVAAEGPADADAEGEADEPAVVAGADAAVVTAGAPAVEVAEPVTAAGHGAVPGDRPATVEERFAVPVALPPAPTPRPTLFDQEAEEPPDDIGVEVA